MNFARLLLAALTMTAAAPAAETVPLFNGVDLSGWTVDAPALDDAPDGPQPFAVRDGVIATPGQPLGHLMTEDEFANYRLVVEYRFTGEPGNCGVLVHASTPRALYGMFPKSIEAQGQFGDAGDFWCICEDITAPDMEARRGPKEKWGVNEGDARRIRNLTDDSENPAGEWNTMTVECFGDRIRVWVNDDLVNDGSGCTATSGKIALQSEGSPAEFRRVELTPITGISDSL